MTRKLSREKLTSLPVDVTNLSFYEFVELLSKKEHENSLYATDLKRP